MTSNLPKNYILYVLIICVILGALGYYCYNKKSVVIETINNNAKNRKIVFYYTEWCGYCNKFKPTWERIEKDVKNITTLKIDCDKYKNIAENNNITEFPTLILYSGQDKTKYEGDFTYESVMNFVN